jgi:LEA14-like dessication related protein
MRRALPLAALGLALALTASGCALLQNLFRTAFREPELRFKTVTLRDLSLGGAGINTVWTLENPNPMGLSIAEIDYAFSVEGKQVIAGKPAQGLEIPANGRTELVFPADVKFQDLAQTVGVFLDKDVATYRAEGHLGIKTPIGVIRIPLSKEGTFEVPKLPALEFDSPRIKNLSLTGATLEIPLRLTNRNSFPLPVAALTGQLSIGGARVGSISNNAVGILSAKGTQTVTLPVTINFLNAVSAANAIRQGKAQISLDGQLQSGQANLPISLSELHNLLH